MLWWTSKNRWNGGIHKGCAVHKRPILREFPAQPRERKTQHQEKLSLLLSYQPCASSSRATLAISGGGAGECCSKQGLGKAQGRQGGRASPSSRAGPSSAASQTLTLPLLPLLPFPLHRSQPHVSEWQESALPMLPRGPEPALDITSGQKHQL